VIGRAGSWSARGAAVVNGALVHGLDYDDTFMPGTIHPSAGVLPATLAAAQRWQRSPSDLLTAYVAGLEVACALAARVPRGAMVARGFHPTSVIGTFAATAAAGRVRGDRVEVVAQALGVAGSLASGLLQVIQEGATAKRMHGGWAAGNGLLALELAGHGVTGPERVFEGDLGLRAFQDAGPLDWDRLDLPPRGGWRLPAVSFKLFPACHYNHALIRSALVLRGRVGDLRDVVRLTVGLHPDQFPEVVEPVERKTQPRTAYEAQFSAIFTVCAALVRGRFSLAELTDEALGDPLVRELAQRCDVVADPDSDFPARFPGSLAVELSDGTVLRHRDDGGSGPGARPAVLRKLRENAGLVLEQGQVEALLAVIEGLDDQPDLSGLTDLLRSEVRAPA
jgi:2-methylcitrate dehydratase PrpD